MKAIFILLLICSTAFAEGPEPDPWWKQVENWQAVALKVIAALTIVVGALTALAMLVLQKVNQIRAYVNDNIEDAKKRMDTQRTDIQTAQKQVVDLALKVAPDSPASTVNINQSPASPAGTPSDPINVTAPPNQPVPVAETPAKKP